MLRPRGLLNTAATLLSHSISLILIIVPIATDAAYHTAIVAVQEVDRVILIERLER